MTKWNTQRPFSVGTGGWPGVFYVSVKFDGYGIGTTLFSDLVDLQFGGGFTWNFGPSLQSLGVPNKAATYKGLFIQLALDANENVIRRQVTDITITIEPIVDGEVTCPSGQTYNPTTALCEGPITPTPLPGGGIIPIAKPPTTPFPPPPSSINLIDWLKWLGQVIQWFVGQLWLSLGDALGYLLNLVWSFIPVDQRKQIQDFLNFWTGAYQFLANPGEFYRKHAAALFEAGSGTPVGIYTGGNQDLIKQNAEAARNAQSIPWDTIKGIQDALKATGEGITNPFDSSVTVDTADFAARTAGLASLDAILLATAVNVAIESIPTINATGIAFLTGAILQATGIGGYLSDYFSKKYDANIGTQLGYFWNEKYQNKIESMANLISKRRKGLITNEEFTRDGVRVTGQTSESVRLDYKDSLQVPGFEDAITYKVRHPADPADFGSLQDLLGINYRDYQKYFDERQYGDVSVRFIQSAANLLGFTEVQVRELLRLNRLDPRVNATLGMSPLDVAVKVMMSRKAIYDEGQVPKEEKQKHFTYSLLIKLAEAGENITHFMDADLTAEGWDTEHRTVLESYINATIAAKAAKKPAA